MSGACVRTHSTASDDFWWHRDGTIKLRIVWMGYDCSLSVRLTSGGAVPNDKLSMDEFSCVVSEELFLWMTEVAADPPPFEDD